MHRYNSTKLCGMSVVTDTSENGVIHCLKVGEVAAEAILEIAQPTSKLQSRMILETQFLTSMMTKKKWKWTNY